jgi:hypothetical protein
MPDSPSWERSRKKATELPSGEKAGADVSGTAINGRTCSIGRLFEESDRFADAVFKRNRPAINKVKSTPAPRRYWGNRMGDKISVSPAEIKDRGSGASVSADVG